MSVKRKGIVLMKKRWKKIMCGILMASSLVVPFYAQTADASDTLEYTGRYKGDKQPKDGEINAVQFNNRMILRQAMLRHGFKPLDTEWWHFTLENEPYPDTYFTFPVRQTGR